MQANNDNCLETPNNNCVPNTVSGGIVSSYTFPTTQLPPSPLPDYIPATAITYTFPNSNCGLSLFDGLNCAVKSKTVDDALNTIAEYFCTFPSSLSSGDNNDFLIFQDGKWHIKNVTEALIYSLNNILSRGQYIGHDGTTAQPLFLCDGVTNCLENFLRFNNHIITLTNGSLASVALEDTLQEYLLSKLRPNQYLTNLGGALVGVDLETSIKDILSLSPGNFFYGCNSGGLNEVAFCPVVLDCLDSALTSNGEFFLAGAGGALQVADFASMVVAALNPLLRSGEIFYGAGLQPTSLCTAILDANCLPPGQFFFNTGGGTTITDFDTEVANSILSTLPNNHIFLGGFGVVDICTAVAICVPDLLPNQIHFGTGNAPTYLCDALVTAGCFDGNPGEIYINDGNNIPVATNLFTYLNTYHLPPSPTNNVCQDELTTISFNHASNSWVFTQQLPAKPSSQDIINNSPPTGRNIDNTKMYIEWSSNGECAEWTAAPRQINHSILVPTDFPTLQTALNWLQGMTIDRIAIDVQQDEPAVIIDGINGRLFINMNNNVLGGFANTSPRSHVFLENATVTGGVTTTDGATTYITNVNSVNHTGDGFAANRNSTMIFTTPTTANNNTESGFRSRNNSLMLFLAGAVSNTNGTGFIASSGGLINVINGFVLQALNNTSNGVVAVEGGKVLSEGIIEVIDNTTNGIESANAGFVKAVTITANNNGGVGIRARAGGTITAIQDINISDNATIGLVCDEQAKIQSNANLTVTRSGVQNIQISNTSNLNVLGVVNTNNAGVLGIRVTENSNLKAASLLSTDNGGNGLVVNIQSSTTIESGDLTLINNANNGLIVALNSVVLANTNAANINNNSQYGVRVFDQSTLVLFNANIQNNLVGVDVVNGSSGTVYNSNVTSNTNVDVNAADNSMIRIQTVPYNSSIGTSSPPVNVTGNFGSIII